jgi:hypothetical protein
MTRFTTIAKTGRLTNKSVNFMSASHCSERKKYPSSCSSRVLREKQAL